MYGDKDRRFNSATTAMQVYQPLPNESVRVYANSLKANWRRAGRNLITHEVVLYDGHGRACGTPLKRNSDLGSPAAKTDSTHSTNSSTVRRPRSSNRTTKSPVDSNSKGKQGSHRKAAIRNVIFDYPSPNLQKTRPAIPIIPKPGIQHRSSPISPVEAAVPTIYSPVAFKASLQKLKGKPAMHSLQQRRPLYLICNLG